MEKEIPQLFPEGPEPPMPPPVVEHVFRKHAILIGVVLLMALSMGTYVLVSPSEDKNTDNTPAPALASAPTPVPPKPTAEPTPTPPGPTATPTPSMTPTPTIPPGTAWKMYANTKQGYRIKYSPDWVAKDLGELEPKIPSYVSFNPSSASESSRFITIGVTTRTYEEQLALGASSSAITVAGIKGTKQSFQDSDGNTSTVVILPRTNDLIVLRAKTAYLTYFNLMLSTLYVVK